MSVFTQANATPSLLFGPSKMFLATSMPPCHWNVQTDLSQWKSQDLLHDSTLYVINPLVARQSMNQAITLWVESPLDSEHFFLVPRVLQGEFGRVKKRIALVGQFHPPLHAAVNIAWSLSSFLSAPFPQMPQS
jgi:hypothetical protein